MYDLTFDEIDAVSGGIVPVGVLAGAVVIVAAVALGVGVRNGYQDEKLKANVKMVAR